MTVVRTLESPVRCAILSLVLGLLGVAGLAWLSLLLEMPPVGEACHYQLDVGSGPSGTGTESIDWNYGLFPSRVCNYVDGSGEPAVYPRTSLFRDVWPLVAALIAGSAYVGLRCLWWLSSRIAARAQSE